MPKRNIIYVIAILAAGAVVFYVHPHQEQKLERGPLLVPGRADRICRRIRQAYFRPVDEDAQLQAAIRGMVSDLDEFSTYIPPGEAADFQRRMDGFARGLGLRAVREGRWVVVREVLPGSPAADAGIHPGQRLVMLNGVSANAMKPEDLREALQTGTGESLELTVQTPGAPMRTLTLTASEYRVESVTGLYRTEEGRWIWTLADGVAYVRIREFVNDTLERLQQAFRSVGPARGLILDLRGNPGGKGDVAIQVADLFLREGVIARIVSRTGPEEIHEAHAQGTLPEDMLMVVLVDGTTASSAELVAGALQCAGRAVIVGAPTQGKGCIQSMIDLGRDLGTVNLTTSEFLLPGVGSITPEEGGEPGGIRPDIEIAVSSERNVKLARLRAALRSVRPPRARTRPATSPRAPDAFAELLEYDDVLSRGAELLDDPDAIRAIVAEADRRRQPPEGAPESRQPRAPTAQGVSR